MLENTTIAEEPQWNSKPAWKLPGWAEPLMVMTIIFGAMFVTRKRGNRVFRGRSGVYKSALDGDDTACSSDELLDHDACNEHDAQETLSTTKHLPKIRTMLCLSVKTPNTARFKNNLHSRVLQRFPFLVEMFYWVINYAFYRMTAILSQKLFAGRGIWTVAESHGLAILDFEQHGLLSHIFSLRRTMNLTNFMAFTTHDDAQSVWMSGKFVNSLAAMPSVHFAYAFAIGCTLIYHSGILRRKLEY
ncbi:hypothetical protein E4T42_06294 [Aureobasidium subglaciale]|nr:hypothetical protein E4T42_06294 [Aureobasidium subglaciale]